ncbi:serine/threonine-protein kinase isoform X3 [Canna indica]|uniref:Serine/threonine-protein kinase isoform X3 n=1 Tax=Canna indica TaxID=4628 RepID=A0AAQ3K777_9LILI|nr:serine/threonine-protein kinase isoform X3 [Canna indica]
MFLAFLLNKLHLIFLSFLPTEVNVASSLSTDMNVFNSDMPGMENVKIYTYKELKNATDDFSPVNKIGEGGFGSVYKGKLRDGTVVAIKALSSESNQGAREFLTEITVISGIIHDNLVRLYGCCVEGSHRILVYNYLENNSLSQTLLGPNHSNIQFNWRSRVKICVGVARALLFLHEEVRPHVVHRDIKASNILLDKDLTPKISDFGLAKLLPTNMTHVSTRVAGTIGYLAPEYAVRGQVTRKSDVYSYGVLLLEIVTGRCNTNTRLPYEDQFLLERTWALYESGKLANIIDSSLTDDLDVEEACRFLKVGLLCTQDNMKLRPPMSKVVKMLTGEKDVNSQEITKPGIIDDFMNLKIRSKNKADNMNKSSISLSVLDTPSSSATTTCPSMTFTAISERD